MRKTLIVLLGLISFSPQVWGQDSLKTTTLSEIVVTGTKFDLPVEKSGKTIFKLSKESLERNSGKSLADLLNEVPGIQIDGNFSTPGTNVSYYVRGGRNRNTLVLIDGVPLNDPSAINAEYDLRYIPVSQIESVEVLKGGLSTLYGTNAAAGVINITLKKSSDKKVSGEASVEAGSYGTYSQNIQVSGSTESFSYLVNGGNLSSEGFSSARDNDPLVKFDKDGFKRQNVLAKIGYAFSPAFNIDFQTAYETFEADFDAYEFNDNDDSQKNNQLRVGLIPQWKYSKGKVEGKFFINKNEKEYFGSFPSTLDGTNVQGEIIHRHNFSKRLSSLSGLNYQKMSFNGKDPFGQIKSDLANMSMLDPYTSIFIDLESGFTLHAGIRLNTHSVYGSKFVYNINPAMLFNQNRSWNYKVFASVSTSYITPTLYQLFADPYGNDQLIPEQATNYELGFAINHQKLSVTGSLFSRDETSPIDFVSSFDSEGNFVGGYENTTNERNVKGIEAAVSYTVAQWISLAGNYSYLKTDKPSTFQKIPNSKIGLSITATPIKSLIVSVKYNHTGERTAHDFFEGVDVPLRAYSLVDVFVSYGFVKDKLTVYGAVNNLLDEDFVALYGYTTRGRNFNAGIRFRF